MNRLLSEQILTSEKIVLQKQNEAKREKQFIGSLKIYKGQRLWELNFLTSDIIPVELKNSVLNLDGSVKINYTIKDKCWYCVAVNLKNAKRKFLQMLKEK